jgi:hypothetical protein
VTSTPTASAPQAAPGAPPSLSASTKPEPLSLGLQQHARLPPPQLVDRVIPMLPDIPNDLELLTKASAASGLGSSSMPMPTPQPIPITQTVPAGDKKCNCKNSKCLQK